MNKGDIFLKGKKIRSSVIILIKCFIIISFIASGFGCNEYVPRISNYDDPSRAYNGYTYLQTSLTLVNAAILCIDMDGGIEWEYFVPYETMGAGSGFMMLNDGTMLASLGSGPAIIDSATDEVLWKDPTHKGHHSIAKTPQESVLMLVQETFTIDDFEIYENCTLLGDIIREIDMNTKEVIWEWSLRDYVDPRLHYFDENVCAGGSVDFAPRGDWSHCNTVKYYPNFEFNGQTYNAILLNSRQLDTFYMIDHATGNILYSVGQHGTFGAREFPEEPLFRHPHEVMMLENGNFLMYDNRNLLEPFRSRALEIAVDPIAQTAEKVWSWTQPQEEVMYDVWGGDADRLPNGNTLIVNSGRGRIFEVAPNGEKVWELELYHPVFGTGGLHQIYKAERVPY